MNTNDTKIKYDVAAKYMSTENITLHLIAHKDNIKMYDVMNHYKSCFKSLGNQLIPQYMNASIYLGKNTNSFICFTIGNPYNIKEEHYDKYVTIKLNDVKSANVLPKGCPTDRVYTQGKNFNTKKLFINIKENLK